MKLLTIIQKNLRILIRSKISALIIFLGPLLLVSLIGLSFSNTQLPGLAVGVHSESYSDFTESIIDKIGENNFEITKYDSSDECSDQVKRGDASICLLFPKDMDSSNNEVTFVVDYSKINLVWIVVDVFSNTVGERTNELRQSYAGDLLGKIIETRADLETEKTTIDNAAGKQGDAQSAAASAVDDLNEITVTTSFGEEYDKADITSNIDTTVSKIDDALDEIDEAKSVMSDNGLSTGDLNTAKNKLEDAKIYLAGNNSIDSLESMVLDINNALESAIGQLNTIKSQKDLAQGSIVTLQSSLGDIGTALTELKNDIDVSINRIKDIQSSDAERLVSPIRTRIQPVTTQETHFNYLFPTLIVLIIMITAILLSSTLVMNEKKSRSYFRNFISPTSDLVFNSGTYLTALTVIAIQLFIFLVTSAFFFDTNVVSVLGTTVLILFLITTIFILSGMIIGYFFKSEETYVLASITVSALLLFLSSTILPIESISDTIRMFASFTPFVVSENILRQAMFFNFELGAMSSEFAILLGYIVILIGIVFGVQKLMRTKFKFKFKKKK